MSRSNRSKFNLYSGLVGVSLFFVLALSADLFSSVYGWGVFQSDLSLTSFPAPPSLAHWLGTDDRGRDVLVRLLFGLRYSLGFAIVVWGLSYSIGIFLGAIMGYLGGAIDLLGQRLIEIVETVPFLYLALLLLSGLGRSFWVLVLVNVLSGWMMISVYMRGQVLKEKAGLIAESAKALGASPARILFRHILPLSALPVFVFSPLALASYLITLVQLDFLGLGLQPPTPSWGELLGQAHTHFPEAWWLLVFPLLGLVGLLLSFQAISSGIKS
ncbi:MAG: ABC transporter permease [Bdellovibrionales bacterium]|nr:ABC transporter permease [Bdellovibrionales bacterium]